MVAGTTTLILAVHAHQPVGNFGWVFGEAYTKAYRPFLDAIERHPSLKWSFHYSGPLVDWLAAEHPEYLRRLAALIRRGQAEVVSGGYAEPILPLIPARDAVGQIQRFTRQLTRLGLGPCRGAWLAERVWEPSLPATLRAAGLEYAIVDDHHLILAGLSPEEASVGYWMTEDGGATTALFPSSKALRYLVPFKPVAEVIEHLRARRGPPGRAVVLADDLEKFGLWPGTARWVYEEGWLEAFCRALEQARDWLTTTTFSRFLEAAPSRGRVYVPCASYEELMQWAGGSFRNFLTKYPEANTLHKKMLWVSRRLAAARVTGHGSRVTLREAEEHLYRGQGNDAYWHGVFGGIYLNHLRTATARELLTAERTLDRLEHGARPWTAAAAEDLDGDGQPDLLLRSGLMDVWIVPAQGGAIVEWDDKTRAFNLTNTLTRRPEPYHAALKTPAPAPVPVAAAAGAGDAPATIHAGVKVKDTAVAEALIYDRYRRMAAVDHVWASGTGDPQAFARGELPVGAFVEQPYRWRLARHPDGVQAVLRRDGEVTVNGRAIPIRLTKTITLARRHPSLRVAYTVLALVDRPVPLRVGSEWNVALKDPHFNRIGAVADARRLTLTDVHADVRIELALSRPAGCWYHPVETVSDSEAGLERTYQQVGALVWWDCVAVPRRPWRAALTVTVRAGGVHVPV